MQYKQAPARPINNDIYDQLGDRWHTAKDDAIALLRAESRLRNPWVSTSIRSALGAGPKRVLDIGCGGGFLSNHLAGDGHIVTGLDASPASLAVARRYDATGSARYQLGDALHLPFEDGSFDVVCAMDFLEHVDDPAAVVAQASRVLAPGGVFFFHTFNRNPAAWLLVIKFVEWTLRTTPPDMHVLDLFLKPGEVRAMCDANGMDVRELHGSMPRILTPAFAKLVTKGIVSDDFEFCFTRLKALAYSGLARKRGTYVAHEPVSTAS